MTAIPPVAGLIGMIMLSRHSDHVGERFYYAAMTFLIAAAGFRDRRLRGDAGLDHHRIHGCQCRCLWYAGRVLDHSAILHVAGECAGRDRPGRHDRQHRRRHHPGRDRTRQGRLGQLHHRILVVTGVLVAAAALVLIARSQLVKE